MLPALVLDTAAAKSVVVDREEKAFELSLTVNALYLFTATVNCVISHTRTEKPKGRTVVPAGMPLLLSGNAGSEVHVMGFDGPKGLATLTPCRVA